uniref:Methylenetetrahydrofolate reductase (NAD(P)H) n=1 Tax=Aureoumbra lagunensis TaxID=44058 RepID=A0A7S3K2T2_9STRA|mmetsp:Transcript_15097/g.22674  ORF Transcript_15097/g.22674 Transcript_15097/m.22674 type:complete len:398 (+) Transcript_15097:100-1293(+)
MENIVDSLTDATRPTFLIGEVPPMEGTTPGAAQEICTKFVNRARSIPVDGYIIYDIQDEESRSSEPRPFPFRQLTDPSGYAALVRATSGKPTVVYKCIADNEFENWLQRCENVHGHQAINVVGRASSKGDIKQIGPSMNEAMAIVQDKSNLAFGCVCIAERHTQEYAQSRGHAAPREHENLLRKQAAGAQWFISQAVYDPIPTVALLRDYAAACKERGLKPKKIVLTFTPVSRPKTMNFLHWLGVQVPEETKNAILEQETPQQRVDKSVQLLCDCLDYILTETKSLEVPIGISVESVSIYKAEINAVHELFAKLQQRVLDARNLRWTVQWIDIALPRRPSQSNLSIVQASPRQHIKTNDDKESSTSSNISLMHEPFAMLALGATIMAIGVIIGSKFH